MAIELISTIKPKNGGSFPIAEANDIKGGYHSVSTIEERDSIPEGRRQANMLCYVENVGMFRLSSDLTTWVKDTGTTGGTGDFEIEVNGELTDDYTLAVNLNEVSDAYKSVYENLYSQFQIMFSQMQKVIDTQQKKIDELESRIFALENETGKPDKDNRNRVVDYKGDPLTDYKGEVITNYSKVIEKVSYITDYIGDKLLDYNGNVVNNYSSTVDDIDSIQDYSNGSLEDYNGNSLTDYGKVIYLVDYKSETIADYKGNKIYIKEGVV